MTHIHKNGSNHRSGKRHTVLCFKHSSGCKHLLSVFSI
ncbi:unnamed protein product [Leptidea sinapis]|uniref:Uncharacterized protein n=1 Tax=Leptidea sinapis TaxID=189913 RepID=A0A5E4QMN1_9NEOP|nr:unnamed protein product [Leptidea sinapis]